MLPFFVQQSDTWYFFSAPYARYEQFVCAAWPWHSCGRVATGAGDVYTREVFHHAYTGGGPAQPWYRVLNSNRHAV